MTWWLALYLIGAAGMALYVWAYADDLGMNTRDDGAELAVCAVCVLLWPVFLAASIIAKIDGR